MAFWFIGEIKLSFHFLAINWKLVNSGAEKKLAKLFFLHVSVHRQHLINLIDEFRQTFQTYHHRLIQQHLWLDSRMKNVFVPCWKIRQKSIIFIAVWHSLDNGLSQLFSNRFTVKRKLMTRKNFLLFHFWNQMSSWSKSNSFLPSFLSFFLVKPSGTELCCKT